jgi:hypothetical protein
VQNDFTFAFANQWYQLTATQSIAVRKKDRVTVEEHTNGTIHIQLRNKELNYEVLPVRPRKTKDTLWMLANSTARIPYKPAANHPWRLKKNAEIVKQNLFKTKQRIPIHS